MSLKIPTEELGRFLLAYNRGVFKDKTLGQAFNQYYQLKDPVLANEKDESTTLTYVKLKYTGRLE